MIYLFSFTFVHLDSYPWWPAVVHTSTSPSIPRNIYNAWLKKCIKRNTQQLFIVQFYDKQESWWVTLSFLIDWIGLGCPDFCNDSRQSVLINKLALLGEDLSNFFTRVIFFLFWWTYSHLELDEENLNSSAKQKWKPSASKQQCREAYELRWYFCHHWCWK